MSWLLTTFIIDSFLVHHNHLPAASLTHATYEKSSIYWWPFITTDHVDHQPIESQQINHSHHHLACSMSNTFLVNMKCHHSNSLRWLTENADSYSQLCFSYSIYCIRVWLCLLNNFIKFSWKFLLLFFHVILWWFVNLKRD